MKNKILVVVILFTTATANAQTSIKLYNQTTVNRTTLFEQRIDSTKQTIKHYNIESRFFQPTIAIQWKGKRKKNFHQISINDFTINRNEEKHELSDSIYTHVLGGTIKVNYSFSLSYEYWQQVYKSKNNKHQFFVVVVLHHFISPKK